MREHRGRMSDQTTLIAGSLSSVASVSQHQDRSNLLVLMALHRSMHRIGTAVNKRLGSFAGPVMQDDCDSIRRNRDHRSGRPTDSQQADTRVCDRQMLLHYDVSAHRSALLNPDSLTL